MDKKYFVTDGIRGQANSFTMTGDVAMRVAMATAHVLRQGEGPYTNRVIIGKDTRLSCYMLEQALTSGFLSMGMDVILSGPIPTPGVAMLTRSLRADIGVMISASHNVYTDNGIKLFGSDGMKLNDDLQEQVEALLGADAVFNLVSPGALGKASRLDDVVGRYVEFIKSSMPRGRSLSGLKVIVDCAHGAAYKVAPQVLWELQADVVAIGVTPDGRNINAEYGATATGNLQKAVLEHGADVGIALDGDADRLIMVDEKGEVIDGDQLMAALAVSLKSQNLLSRNGLVTTVMSNLGMERYLKQHNLSMVRADVGDRNVVEAMLKGGYNLGGEQSGHIILSDFATTGDGLLAALRVLRILKDHDQPASEALRLFTPCPQLLQNVRYGADAQMPLDKDEVKEAIAAAERQLDNDGRLLVRKSGTENLIRVMAEGDDPVLVKNVVGDLCAVIEKAA